MGSVRKAFSATTMLPKIILIFGLTVANILASVEVNGGKVSSISINTGSIQKAESDCKAVMEICDGERNCCQTSVDGRGLDNPGLDRQRGKTDVYTTPSLLGNCAQEGTLASNPVSAKLTSGGNNGWFVEGIWIRMNTGEVFSCPLGGWLDNGANPAGPGSRKVNCKSADHHHGGSGSGGVQGCPLVGRGEWRANINDRHIPEASGLAYSRRPGTKALWVNNDSGRKNWIFAISEHGRRLADVKLQGTTVRDWEDIALSRESSNSYIYLGDIGDNYFARPRVGTRARRSLTIYKFREPQVLQTWNGHKIVVGSQDIVHIHVKYPGHGYDCEAMAVDPSNQDILLFTKNHYKRQSKVFRVPHGAGDPKTLEYITTLPYKLVTGADISPSGNTLALTSYGEGWTWHKESGVSWANFLKSKPTPCRLSLRREVQREAIAINDGGYWTTSEHQNQPLWFYPSQLPQAQPPNPSLPTLPTPSSGGNQDPPVEAQGPSGTHLIRDLLTGSFAGGEHGAFKSVQRLRNFNGELQEYHKSSVTQDRSNGEITLKAVKHSSGKITSGKIETKGVWTTASDHAVKNRGYVEVRATMPANEMEGNLIGAWPAIWLLGSQPPKWPNCSEIDIVELRNGRPEVIMTTHSGKHHSGNGQHPSPSGHMRIHTDLVQHELIAGLEWNLHHNQIDLTWWMTYFNLNTNSWVRAEPRTLVIRRGANQDYSQFYNAFQKDGLYLIVNLAEGGIFTGNKQRHEVMVDRQPQYVKIKSAKVYRF